MSNIEYLEAPPCEGNVLGYTMGDALASYDFGTLDLPFSIKHIFNLRHTSLEALGVSEAFRAAIDVRAPRSTEGFGIVNHDEKRALLLYDVTTADSGRLPVIFGSSDIYPLQQPDVLEYNRSFIESTGDMVIVDEGHQEALLTDLQNYKLPNRIMRTRKKANDITLSFIDTPQDLMDLYLKVPYATAVDIQTALYYSEILKPGMDDYEIQRLEGTYRFFHNPEHHVESLVSIYTADPMMAVKREDRRFLLYRVDYKGWYVGTAYLNVQGKDWYWVNTNRLRIPSLSLDIPFNLNDAILSHLIEEAQRHGAETFNLGYAYYPYKEFYNPEMIWRKGIRWTEQIK